MSFSPTLPALIALWGVVTIYIVRNRRLRKGYPLPPGPKPLPVIGNLLDIPLKDEAATYNGWANKYGSFSIHKCVFLSSSLPKATWCTPMS